MHRSDIRSSDQRAPEPGQDQVGSDDIIDAEVQNADLGTNAVSGSKVFPSTLTGSDVAPGGLTGSDVATDSLLSSDIAAGAVGTSEHASSIPAARVTRTAQHLVPGQTRTTLHWNSERYDTASMHSNSSTNDAFLFAPVDGIYEVSAHVQWGPVGFLSPRTYIELDRGTTTTSIARSEESDTRALSVSTMVKLNAGQSVVVVVFQGTSNTQSIAKISEASPEFSMTWLAPGP